MIRLNLILSKTHSQCYIINDYANVCPSVIPKVTQRKLNLFEWSNIAYIGVKALYFDVGLKYVKWKPKN